MRCTGPRVIQEFHGARRAKLDPFTELTDRELTEFYQSYPMPSSTLAIYVIYYVSLFLTIE